MKHHATLWVVQAAKAARLQPTFNGHDVTDDELLWVSSILNSERETGHEIYEGLLIIAFRDDGDFFEIVLIDVKYHASASVSENGLP